MLIILLLMIKHGSKNYPAERILFVIFGNRGIWLFFILFCRILPTWGLLPIWGIHSQFRRIFRDGHWFIFSVQSSYVLKEIFNGTIVSEKCYFSAPIPSAFETNPQGHFMGIFSSRFHLANFRFRVLTSFLFQISF